MLYHWMKQKNSNRILNKSNHETKENESLYLTSKSIYDVILCERKKYSDFTSNKYIMLLF